MPHDDPFYIGYRRRAPAGLRRFLRALVAALVLAGAGLAALLAALQGPSDPGVFEFGQVRELAGVVRERPHPVLLVPRPGAAGGWSGFYLVAAGKHGAGGEVDGLAGRPVRLRGTLIHRQGETMVELVSGSVEVDSAATAAPGSGTVDLGTVTLRGEIVDSKCFLGVMKPGRGKPHRACATLCIRGGVPPVLRVETAGGEFRHFLLTDAAGGAVNDRVRELVAAPVEITGRVHRAGDQLILAADPRSYRRLEGSAPR